MAIRERSIGSMTQDSSSADVSPFSCGPLVVGLTVELLEPPQYPGKRRIQLFHAYLECLRQVDLIPLLLPPDASDAELTALLDRVDGVLMTGGDDVDLRREGGPPPPAEVGVIMPPGQQSFGLRLAREVEARALPTLGVCLGMQFLGMAAGATLVQHLENAAEHTKGIEHPVEVSELSRLAALVGAGTHRVPSFHHQALADIPPPYQVSARSEDGVIEAIEHPGQPFLLGVQWHPERDPQGATTRALFSGFAAAVARYREQGTASLSARP